MSWHRFVALGDSLTEGVGDPVPGGLRGWADRLADGLRAVTGALDYENLALRGLTTTEIRDRQLDEALALEPDLVGVIAGMNDVIAPDFDPVIFRRELAATVEPLCDAAATVLTATFPNVTRLMPFPRRMTSSVSTNLERANDVVRRVSERYETVLVDAGDMPDELIRNNFSIDFLHPSPRGHLLIARAFAGKLEALSGEPIPMPELPTGRLLGADSVRHARWLVQQGAIPQVGRTIRRFLRL